VIKWVEEDVNGAEGISKHGDFVIVVFRERDGSMTAMTDARQTEFKVEDIQAILDKMRELDGAGNKK
jgi:predicted RNA-binding protein (virulence factor B family)